MTERLTVGSLFAGIGGFDLAAERAGLEVKWQVEIDPFCRKVLEKHWPYVDRYEDVRRVHSEEECHGCDDCLHPVDILCGGFPCQDVSSSGDKAGLDGERSGLFFEMVRLVRELRPRYVVMENVSDLLVRGMGRVLGELAALGYDAEWECLPAAAFGLPQPRWRVFVVAYPRCGGRQVGSEWFQAGPFAFARLDGDGLVEAVHRTAEAPGIVRGMDDGLPGTVDRVAALGNAVVPQVAEWIFRRIIEADGEAQSAGVSHG